MSDNIDTLMDELAGLRDKAWIVKIMQISPHAMGEMAGHEIHRLAIQARGLEAKIRERANVLAAEVNRRELVAIRRGEAEIPDYLRATP